MTPAAPQSGAAAGLAYHWFGAPQHPPVLLLPGLLDDSATLRRLARALARQRRVLLIDPLGAGGSDAPNDLAAFAWPAQVARLAALLAQLQVTSLDAVGLSLGGMWLQQALVADQDLGLRRVVLAATAADVDPRLACVIESLQGQHDAGLPPAILCRSLLPLLFSPGFLARPAAVPTLLALMLGRPLSGPGLRGQLSALRSHQLGPRLRSVASAREGRRVALVHGSEDFLIPAPAQARLLQALGGAAEGIAAQVMPGAGHCLWFEEPEAFAAILSELLAG